MNIWIVTIGSSDVQLDSDLQNKAKGRSEEQRSDKVWNYWYDDTLKENCYGITFKPKRAYEDKEEPYRIAPRVFGTVYNSASDDVKEEIWNYLTFPLLDNFIAKLDSQIMEKIIILQTDQAEFFPNDQQRRKPKLPYWQDTCELELILRHYFSKHFPNAELVPKKLTAYQGTPGLDDWDNVLSIVRAKLNEIKLEPETVYVSHQAGTPAISSAVQFSSLSLFGDRVRFLASNEYNNETIIIDSPVYLQGIKIQQAKKLIVNGSPGAALELIKEIINEETRKKLKKKVDEFNIKLKTESGKNDDEFEPKNAIERVRKALDLIEIFFKQENYIQGVTLLAASQETFLKATIKYDLDKYVNWNEEGLFLKSQKEIKESGEVISKEQLIANLNLPDEVTNKGDLRDKYFSVPNYWIQIKELYQILDWVKNIKYSKGTSYWYSLEWSCTHRREFDYDRRNQLMHNLRGVEKIDVIHYLLGCPEDEKNANEVAKSIYQKEYANKTPLEVEDVVNVYHKHVKDPFQETLKKFGWNDNNLQYTPLQDQLADLANSLDAEVKKTDS